MLVAIIHLLIPSPIHLFKKDSFVEQNAFWFWLLKSLRNLDEDGQGRNGRARGVGYTTRTQLKESTKQGSEGLPEIEVTISEPAWM